ncbi:hypothetical protein JTB14_001997 [Gonioctena quinquepunctata]|nr:hypothetical protein JTB14_001997 [Gonioctena quinquepunctata]
MEKLEKEGTSSKLCQPTANSEQTEKKRKLEDEEYAGLLKDCSTAINMPSRSASLPVVELEKNENSLFGKYITLEINEIKDDDNLDEFKNVFRQ